MNTFFLSLPLKKKRLAIYIAMLSPLMFANASAENKKSTSIGDINVMDQQSRDEQGYDQQYDKNISNIYIGKDLIERYHGSSPSDILKNAIGVYSGDARNSGAIDPNIRGIQGQGRIPVTIDGTEQAITVYRGYNGSNNRNYLDPNLISNISIDKGSSLDPNIKTSTGGGIAIKTLGIDDIVPRSDKFGLNIKAETRSNTTNPHAPYFGYSPGMDYRYDPTYQADEDDAYYTDTLIERRAKTTKDNKFLNFQDNAFRIGAGWRTEPVDLLVVYSYRQQGNYFAGKGGAQRYDAPVTDPSKLSSKYNSAYYSTDPFMPFVARIYKPGNEVPNTSNQMQSWLLKNTWRFAGDQAVQFTFRDTHTRFGDIMPSRLGSIPWVASGEIGGDDNIVPQWPLSEVHLQAFTADYKWQPASNKWVDFDMSLWFTRTNSDTNNGGGYPRDPLYMEGWDSKRYGKKGYPDPDVLDYRLVSTSLTNSKNNRYGINLSDKIRLTPTLNLTLIGNFQYETLGSDDYRYKDNNYASGWYGDTHYDPARNARFPTPRKGKRQENSVAFNFTYTPTSWLQFTAGAKRVSYWSQDDMLKEMVSATNNHESWAILPSEEITAYQVRYYRLATPEETSVIKKLDPPISGKDMEWAYYHNMVNEIASSVPPEFKYLTQKQKLGSRNDIQPLGNNRVFNSKLNVNWPLVYSDKLIRSPDTYYISEIVTMPVKNGKLSQSDSPYYNGTIDINKLVPNTAKYDIPDSKAPDLAYQYNYGQMNTNNKVSRTLDINELGKKRKDHAWAPVFSAAVSVTDDARIYARYAETVRMPSIFEDTVGFSAKPNNIHGYQNKPEHSKTTEIGFIYNLQKLLHARHNADFRINWYHTDIENVFDRDANLNFRQFDKMKVVGIEALARYDNGGFFASAGLDYNLNYQVCDDQQAMLFDPLNQYHYPTCVYGGFPGGFLRTSIPPRYSLSANIGGRLFNEKLELGTRWLYHSSVVNKDEQKYPQWLTGGTFNDPMRWNPVLTVDAYLDWRINKLFTVELSGENLTNRYYLDPLTRSMMPAPGRAIKLAVTAQF